ncbi:MAG: glucuronate isomerase [Verrucomicrobiota bacterium]
MKFIHENFLLNSPAARRFYHEFAAAEPIFDFHCHLSPRDIAENRQFNNLSEIWLDGDHYKWRVMRANGVPERFCSGDADPFAKFEAWSATVPQTLRNPLYHWTHLELQRYFGIDELLNPASARRIWNQTKEILASPECRAQGILTRFRVAALCTTDDPTDDLRHHRALLEQGLVTRVFPAFRPDRALAIHNTEAWNAWVDRLQAASGIDIASLSDFLEALRQRHEVFHAMGCRLSDHGLNQCPTIFCSENAAAQVFAKARARRPASLEEQAGFFGFMMLFFAGLDAAKGWAKQLHLGALRNANTSEFKRLGPDAGFDSIGDVPQAAALAGYLDRLLQENALPKMILYNANPSDNYVFASMIGNFQDGRLPGKIQFGPAWWFLDQKDGMQWQLDALSNLGLLARFVGMVTDSRSFLSFPRHEYFRRLLCQLIGREVESGELPADEALLGQMIRNICFANARDYLACPGVAVAQESSSKTSLAETGPIAV